MWRKEIHGTSALRKGQEVIPGKRWWGGCYVQLISGSIWHWGDCWAQLGVILPEAFCLSWECPPRWHLLTKKESWLTVLTHHSVKLGRIGDFSLWVLCSIRWYRWHLWFGLPFVTAPWFALGGHLPSVLNLDCMGGVAPIPDQRAGTWPRPGQSKHHILTAAGIGSGMDTWPRMGQSQLTPRFLLELLQKRCSLSAEVPQPVECESRVVGGDGMGRLSPCLGSTCLRI